MRKDWKRIGSFALAIVLGIGMMESTAGIRVVQATVNFGNGFTTRGDILKNTDKKDDTLAVIKLPTGKDNGIANTAVPAETSVRIELINEIRGILPSISFAKAQGSSMETTAGDVYVNTLANIVNEQEVGNSGDGEFVFVPKDATCNLVGNADTLTVIGRGSVTINNGALINNITTSANYLNQILSENDDGSLTTFTSITKDKNLDSLQNAFSKIPQIDGLEEEGAKRLEQENAQILSSYMEISNNPTYLDDGIISLTPEYTVQLLYFTQMLNSYINELYPDQEIAFYGITQTTDGIFSLNIHEFEAWQQQVESVIKEQRTKEWEEKKKALDAKISLNNRIDEKKYGHHDEDDDVIQNNNAEQFVNPEEQPTDPEEQPTDPEEQPTDPEEQPTDPEEQPTGTGE